MSTQNLRQLRYFWAVACMTDLIAISAGYWLVVKLTCFDLELGPGKPAQKRDADRWAEVASLTDERADVKSPTAQE